jgi:hypothetical protein
VAIHARVRTAAALHPPPGRDRCGGSNDWRWCRAPGSFGSILTIGTCCLTVFRPAGSFGSCMAACTPRVQLHTRTRSAMSRASLHLFIYTTAKCSACCGEDGGPPAGRLPWVGHAREAPATAFD